jgi:hypothetical protein
MKILLVLSTIFLTANTAIAQTPDPRLQPGEWLVPGAVVITSRKCAERRDRDPETDIQCPTKKFPDQACKYNTYTPGDPNSNNQTSGRRIVCRNLN